MQLFLAFIVALAGTVAAMPLLARWAPHIGLTDSPGPRKVHSNPMPRVGGIAMALGSFVPMLFLSRAGPHLGGLVAGLAVLLVFGVWDDRHALGYRTKLAGQLIAVALAMFAGDVRIESLTFDGRIALPGWASAGLTFVFLVGVTNAVNLADGLDGLAGGIALLCCTALAVLGAASGNYMVTSIALIQAGAIIGFLRFNTHPARVFMGDCGSQMLGFNMGVLSILVTQGDTNATSAALPLLLIGVPIFDTLAVMWRRARERRPLFAGDRNHLHHRLLALGFTHGESVILICMLQGLLFLLAYFLRFESDLVIVAVFCALALLVLGTLREAGRRGWRARTTEGQPHVVASIPHGVRRLIGHAHLPAVLLSVSGASLVAYGTVVLVGAPQVGADVGILSIALFALLVLLIAMRAQQPLRWLERAAAYMSAVLLVYLDQTSPAAAALAPRLSWLLLGIAAAAALLRFCVGGARRLDVTPLDVLVLFLAIVIPNLPTSIALPAGLAAGVAKAVILLYVVEMLFTLDLRRAVPRTLIAVTLVAIAARAFLPTML